MITQQPKKLKLNKNNQEEFLIFLLYLWKHVTNLFWPLQILMLVLFIGPHHLMIWNPALWCKLTNCRWNKLQSQRLTGAFAGNQLLPNTSLERDGKALIDLVDGLSSGSVVFVSVTDGDLADHDARLGGGTAKRLLGHGDQAQAITATLLVVV